MVQKSAQNRWIPRHIRPWSFKSEGEPGTVWIRISFLSFTSHLAVICPCSIIIHQKNYQIFIFRTFKGFYDRSILSKDKGGKTNISNRESPCSLHWNEDLWSKFFVCLSWGSVDRNGQRPYGPMAWGVCPPPFPGSRWPRYPRIMRPLKCVFGLVKWVLKNDPYLI